MNENLEHQLKEREHKYQLKREHENLVHQHIMEEIAAAAAAGMSPPKRTTARR